MERGAPLIEPIVRAMDAAERSLGESVGLQDLARAAGLSRFHFHRLFQRAMRETPAQFVERLRLERAALLLLAARVPITELAWDVGFRNPETFARRFRARFDVTARDYRRNQMRLWNELGVVGGEDPGGPGGPIEVRELPRIELAFRRSIGDDEGFTFRRSEKPWRSLGANATTLVGRTLDWPGITPPGRVRSDHGIVVEGGADAKGLCIGHVARGCYATIEVAGPGPTPNEVYQRLFVWAAAGAHRLAPGPMIELFRDERITVCQPVSEQSGGAEWFPSSRSKSTVH